MYNFPCVSIICSYILLCDYTPHYRCAWLATFLTFQSGDHAHSIKLLVFIIILFRFYTFSAIIVSSTFSWKLICIYFFNYYIRYVCVHRDISMNLLIVWYKVKSIGTLSDHRTQESSNDILLFAVFSQNSPEKMRKANKNH